MTQTPSEQKEFPYKYLLFDLDHTLWDFDRNSKETLDQLFYEFELDRALNVSVDTFMQIYIRINREMWKQYELGKINQEELRHARFYNAMAHFGFKNKEVAEELAEKYLSICPYKKHLIPKTIETLDAIQANPVFQTIIVTNGFAEVQAIKMKESGLDKYFEHVVSSESAGVKKPAGPIFKYSLDKIGGNRKQALMIGDSFHSDVAGARNFGIDQVYFNPDKNRHNQKATYEITCISDLLKILKLE